MFITVLYGDNKQQIFNPNCPNHVLLNAIKSRCKFDHRVMLDLSDQAGSVKNLHGNPMDYGTAYVEEREEVVLLQVRKERESDDGRVTYFPLLDAKCNDQEFIARLNPKPSGASLHRHYKQQSRRHSGADSGEDKPVSRTAGRRNSTSRRGSVVSLKKGHKSGASGATNRSK